MKRMIAVATLLALAGTALGQSFNVDLNKTSGIGAGVPASTYGAAAAQPGTWNDVNSASASTVTLKNLDGTTSTVTMHRSTSGAVSSFNGVSDTGATFDAGKLLLDFEEIPGIGTLFYTFNNLSAGTYAVYTYGVSPNASGTEAGITVTGTTSDYQYVGGDLVGSALAPLDTHAIHFVTITAGATLQVKVSDSPFGNAKCNGIQIKKMPSAAARIRFYVDDSASGATDGTTWDKALPSLQTAVTAAAAIGGSRTEIWVAGGTYKPTAGTLRTATFDIPSGLHMYGGFTGDEATLADRWLPIFTSSIMSGSIGGSAQSDNSYTVVTMTDCDGTTVVDGFSIARGNNTDTGKGGGLRIVGGGPRISHCRILSNWASIDGAGAYSRDASPIFSNCTFFDGDSGGTGGAIFQSTSGTLNVYNCEFLGNHADGEGGAIKVLFADAYIGGSFFSGNDTSFSNGGAVAVGGTGAGATITNCTLSLNQSAGTAGGVYGSPGAAVTLHNSILWGNTDAVPGTVKDEQAYVSSGSGSSLTSTFTTIQGASGSSGANPLFVNADGANGVAGDSDDDCRLQPASPCIDAGENGALPLDIGDVDFDGTGLEILPFDLDYQARRVDVPGSIDTGSGTGPLVDRGAYEVQYTPPCPADLNGDGLVDFSDYLQFLNFYDGQDEEADFNGDGLIDFSDYLEFLNHYDAGC